MVIYLFSFLFSFLFCFLGEKKLKIGISKNNIKKALPYFAVSVFIVSVLAGLRDYSVGTDTIIYAGNYEYFGQKSLGLNAFISAYSDFEIGFTLFSYFFSIFFKSAHWYLFFCAAWIYGFTLSGLYYFRKQCSISIAWAFFLIFSIGELLNIMRQYMAFAIAFWAFHFVFEKQYKKFILFSVIAFSFHSTAIVFLLIFAVYLLLRKKNTVLIKALIICGIIAVCACYAQVLSFLVGHGLGMEKLTKYIRDSSYIFQLNPFLIRIPYLLLIFLQKNAFIKKQNGKKYSAFEHKFEGDFIILMAIIELIFSQTRGILVFLYRMSSYFAVFKYLAYSRVIILYKNEERAYLNIITVIYLFVVFFYQCVISGGGEIYPYTSEILGIK